MDPSPFTVLIVNQDTGEIEVDTSEEVNTDFSAIVHIHMRQHFDYEDEHFLDFKFACEDVALSYNVSISDLVEFIYDTQETLRKLTHEERIQYIIEQIEV